MDAPPELCITVTFLTIDNARDSLEICRRRSVCFFKGCESPAGDQCQAGFFCARRRGMVFDRAGMTSDVYTRYLELQRYVGWTDDDARRVSSVADAIRPHLPPLIEDFYDEIRRHPEALRVVTGGEAQIARLKQTFHRWLTELFSGNYDADYVARRWRVGYRHVEVGLNQVYTNAALSRLRRGLMIALETCLAAEAPRMLAVRQSLNLLIDLDLAIIEDAYQAEFTARQQRIEQLGHDITTVKQAQEQVLQSERLAAIGQMMTGLAHESRNALQRSQACLEMLAMEVQDRPAALDLVSRIQRAQDHLHLLYEEVRDYAAPIRLRCDECDLQGILDETWDHLATQRAGRDAALDYPTGNGRLLCRVDRFALEQVFRNVLENSLSACADPVRIRARFRTIGLGDRPAVEVSLLDNGPGLTAESRARIFEPFFTTKTRGTGLGMAISRRIVEAHGGRIAVGQDHGPGAEILITLPRDEIQGAHS
jgi:signal transduction histidine kinase